MAKVLLINSNRFRHPWPVIPFGLCYIATVLETGGNHDVSFLDLCFSVNCRKDIQDAIHNFHPDVIGISVRNIDDTGGYNVQPLWRLLILIKKSELVLGISFVKRLLYDLKAVLPRFKSMRKKGFTLVSIIPKTAK